MQGKPVRESLSEYSELALPNDANGLGNVLGWMGTGETVIGLLRELNTDGTTVVVITHDHGIASSMSRQVTMRDGVITC